MEGEAEARLGRKYYENINYKLRDIIFDLMGIIFFTWNSQLNDLNG